MKLPQKNLCDVPNSFRQEIKECMVMFMGCHNLKSGQVRVPKNRTQILKPQRSARDGGSNSADRVPHGNHYLVCTLEVPETSHRPFHPEHPPEGA